MIGQATPLPGLLLLESSPVEDARGRFERAFCDDALAGPLAGRRIRQVNVATTHAAGTIRGLHAQREPFAETKIVRCLRGRVFDVAVDLRDDSPTRGRWHAVELAATTPHALLIPEGFAHGFQALTDDVMLLYLHTAPWSAAHETGVRADDPTLAIRWPLPPRGQSERDLALPTFAALSTGDAR